MKFIFNSWVGWTEKRSKPIIKEGPLIFQLGPEKVRLNCHGKWYKIINPNAIPSLQSRHPLSLKSTEGMDSNPNFRHFLPITSEDFGCFHICFIFALGILFTFWAATMAPAKKTVSITLTSLPITLWILFLIICGVVIAEEDSWEH